MVNTRANNSSNNNEIKDMLEFQIPLLHERESVAVMSKEKMDGYKAQGIKIKTGKWCSKEESILYKNYEGYIKRYSMHDHTYLFGYGQKKRSKIVIKELRRTHFYARLGKDLNDRTLRSIYVKAREMFNPLNKTQKAMKDEVLYVRDKQEQVGNKWTNIGKALNRSGQNCSGIYRWHQPNINKGKWSIEEIEKLKSVIEDVAGTTDLHLVEKIKNISWNNVAEMVSSRNSSQCRLYWAEHLAWHPNVPKDLRWTKLHYAALVHVLKKNCCIKDESKLDWKKIQNILKDISPSYIFLQKQLRYLKCNKVPKNMHGNYTKMINFLFKLYEEVYQKFKEK